MYLREIEQPVKNLHGIGERSAVDFTSLGIITIADLLLHIPRSYENRRESRPFQKVIDEGGGNVRINTIVEVKEQHYIGYGKKRTLKVIVRDESAEAALVCFGRNFLERTLMPGRHFFLYGIFSFRYGEIQGSQFEFEPYSGSPKQFGIILPVYPLAGNLSQKTVRKTVAAALREYTGYLQEELPEKIRAERGLPSKKEALRAVHFPKTEEEAAAALELLKFEELFYLQLSLVRNIHERKKQDREAHRFTDELQNRCAERLPFSLTDDQRKVIQEINADLKAPRVMTRLLQGDVGSGKTLVAFLAALYSIGSGFQVAFMVPTEVLARQHADSAARLLEPLGINVAMLTGGVKSERKAPLLKALADGEVHMVMGTHALFSQEVVFHNLGLAVIDEQHRFGVLQRLALLGKGELPDLLLMTATPIPRTLALTVFGDLDISTIKTMPPGRKPIDTHLTREGNEKKVYSWVKREIEKGRQAYFIYPLIQQSDKLALKSAEEMFGNLRKTIFPRFRLGLIHSKLPEEEKQSVMERFVSGDLDILVSTTVVEVGVDVPNATCMVIEHAERFGLAALHQLRGRVGRGVHKSYTFLIFSKTLTENGIKRLKVMKEQNDGFLIAEEDLKIRGPGEMTGVRQAGSFGLKVADIIEDASLLRSARQDAEGILKEDPELQTEENSRIRDVLTRCPPFTDPLTAGG